MRIRKCNNTTEFERVIDDYITQEYAVKQRGEGSAMLQQKKNGSLGGHIVVALLTFWWTFGIGNLVYWLIARAGGDKVMVKLEEATPSPVSGASAMPRREPVMQH